MSGLCTGDEGVPERADQTARGRLLHPGVVPGGSPLGPHQTDLGRVPPQGAVRGRPRHLAHPHRQPQKPRQGDLRVPRLQNADTSR